MRIIVKRRFDTRHLHLIEDRIAGIRLKVMDAVRKTDLQTYAQIGREQIYTALTADLKTVSDMSQSLSLMAHISTMTIGFFMYLLTLSQIGSLAAFIVIAVSCGVEPVYTYSRVGRVAACTRTRNTRL